MKYVIQTIIICQAAKLVSITKSFILSTLNMYEILSDKWKKSGGSALRLRSVNVPQCKNPGVQAQRPLFLSIKTRGRRRGETLERNLHVVPRETGHPLRHHKSVRAHRKHLVLFRNGRDTVRAPRTFFGSELRHLGLRSFYNRQVWRQERVFVAGPEQIRQHAATLPEEVHGIGDTDVS